MCNTSKRLLCRRPMLNHRTDWICASVLPFELLRVDIPCVFNLATFAYYSLSNFWCILRLNNPHHVTTLPHYILTLFLYNILESCIYTVFVTGVQKVNLVTNFLIQFVKNCLKGKICNWCFSAEK